MIEDEVRRFIVEELNGSARQLTNDYELLEHRVLDSLGVFKLVAFLESRYSITVDDEDLVPEHFSTLGTIARFVSSKRQSV